MRIDVLTLFPEVLDPFFSASIVGRAVSSGLVSIRCVNFRDYAEDRHRSVDDRPFGGGPGMVLMCGPIFAAMESLPRSDDGRPLVIMLSPQGERFDQAMAASLSREPWLVILCGHYEGFDERVRIGLGAREVSIGDYVLSGGEPAAAVMVDSIVRLLPGALGHEDAAANDSFAEGLLEYPHFTRPRDFRGMTVPEVLLSGDHAGIAAWRKAQALERTKTRRPDLMPRNDDSTPGGGSASDRPGCVDK